MKRALVLVMLLAAGSIGCNKPSESNCRKAIHNMQRLIGTDKLHSASNVESAVRSCRGASKKASVECAIQAQTLEQLKKCSFYKEQGMTDDEPGTGSAPAPGSGSAPSATGSAPPPSPGSGPAPDLGSAATGSGTGSGSAPPP